MVMGEHCRKNTRCSFMLAVLLLVTCTAGEDPYRFHTWNVTYGDIYPLGVKQQGILINGLFPGPQIESVTNDNLIISVFNSLDEPFLISWNGVQQRRNSWQDGVYGTNCPIPPGQNFTYVLQVKDQIGSYFYFPSLGMHKAAGGFGGFKIASRSVIPVPFPPPSGDFTFLAGDWFKKNHNDLKAILDGGSDLPFPDGLLINGRGSNGYTFTVDQGKTYRFRISNVGLTTSINFRIQGHKMLLVEVEGTHSLQNTYDSLDIHLGQSYSVLVTADQAAHDYFIVVSTRFTSQVLTTTSILHYSNSAGSVSDAPLGGPTIQIDWSLEQARSLRRNLSASGPRPNPQGSYHYGLINTTRTVRLQNSAPIINGKQRFAVNSVSFISADTPLKLADHYNIPGVFSLVSIPDSPTGGGAYLPTSVMAADFRGYAEIVFENPEDNVQSWHIDGHNFFVVGMDGGQWSPASRLSYNLRDTISRCTVQVYPESWTAVYMPLDNVGMWNVRSENWARQYLGQQFYLRVYSPANSWRDEYPIPTNALLCGRAAGLRTRHL
ncbi:PREDICTED: L-ascorbate oxidase homolog isoform X2 [Populus euphratica]|uniref:L-ascorbate oxidase homolog isoform X1 n=1 Tax=Populus euphratica TaxID=75702 RepID=A0AAJ6VGS2_POPEU|nr:PREDICTED: L-ascorbate oxidase homolog isoform X1 [Populus euphratica]XP_011047252.1 PREDICTED: L-ascorbate oxidase homolog isoform X2 [Populus euphratica]